MIAGRCEGHWNDNIHVVMYNVYLVTPVSVSISSILCILLPWSGQWPAWTRDTGHVTRVTLPFVSHDGSIQLR